MPSPDTADDFYDLLGMAPTADVDAIKDAYRREAKRLHPDQGGDAEQFRKLSEAYRTLLDSDARRKYDRRYEEAAKEAGTQASKKAAPYLSRKEITWTNDGRRSPSPVIVSLSNTGGIEDVSQFGPERLSGDFWMLDSDSECVMDGDELYVFTIAPLNVAAMPSGVHKDDLRLFVNDEHVVLTITLTVATPPTTSGDSRRFHATNATASRTKSETAPSPAEPAKEKATEARLGGRYGPSEIVGATLKAHLLIPTIASLLGAIWAETTLQTSEHSYPYGKAVVFLATVSLWTGAPAMIASLVFDWHAWERGASRFAIKNLPDWHHGLLIAAAGLPPIIYAATHWGHRFFANGYGPPHLFWWLAPVALLVTHCGCLCWRAATER